MALDNYITKKSSSIEMREPIEFCTRLKKISNCLFQWNRPSLIPHLPFLLPSYSNIIYMMNSWEDRWSVLFFHHNSLPTEWLIALSLIYNHMHRIIIIIIRWRKGHKSNVTRTSPFKSSWLILNIRRCVENFILIN